MDYFNLVDYLYGPLAFIIIIIIARVRKYRRIKTEPEFKYYTKGLYVKLIGGLSLCLIYTLYYGGGDTVNYMNDSLCMLRLLFDNPSGFFQIMKEGVNFNNLYYFTDETGYPIYYKDPPTFYVVRVIVPFALMGAGSFIVTTLLIATFSYAGIWKLYRLFVIEYPALKKEMAIAILFIPSVFFWGSGVMKDTITLSCIGYYTYSFYWIFIKKQYNIGNFVAIFISTYLILMIKPYIVFALLPGSLLWFVNVNIGNIKNTVIRFMVGPFLFSIAMGGGYLLLISMSNLLGGYAVENVLEKAVITSNDLKADYYGGNSFDIGDFEPTVPSMLAKAPEAIVAAIFRPYLWEARNIVMLISGFESVFLIFITLSILWRLRLYGVFPMAVKSPLLTFSLIFSLFFAFSVGISTSNFGSLVRYRIPILPFYLASLFIMDYYFRNKKVELEAAKYEEPRQKELIE
ncbi:MAG: hypothetical protein M3Q95_10315 [Bacteroidota bacterium]|nr:hypothetical protein [Bacteroidota bacterium]